MFVRGSLFFFLIFFTVLSLTSRAHADNKKDNTANFENSLGQVVQVFQNDDCDHALANDTKANLIDACKEAHETPEIAAIRGNFACSFDLENYVITAKTNVVSPEYHIAPNGDVKQIVKGDLSVTAKECKKITGEKSLASHHPANDDLCFSYYPDKSFSQYQEKAECSESRKPASSVTTPPTTDEEESSDTDVAVDAQQDLISYETAVR